MDPYPPSPSPPTLAPDRPRSLPFAVEIPSRASRHPRHVPVSFHGGRGWVGAVAQRRKYFPPLLTPRQHTTRAHLPATRSHFRNCKSRTPRASDTYLNIPNRVHSSSDCIPLSCQPFAQGGCQFRAQRARWRDDRSANLRYATPPSPSAPPSSPSLWLPHVARARFLAVQSRLVLFCRSHIWDVSGLWACLRGTTPMSRQQIARAALLHSMDEVEVLVARLG